MYGIHNLCPREHKIVEGWEHSAARASLAPPTPPASLPLHSPPLQLPYPLLLGRTSTPCAFCSV